ncbi:MAG: ABC transporter permease [Proteobacteria bacterium]|nr:ABC transporter permease [Pseudomonadota bacterium]
MTFFSFRRTFAIAAKEFQHLRRDRLTGGMIVGIPVIMTLLFGYAINHDIRHLSAGVADQAKTAASRALLYDTQATQVVDLVRNVDSKADLERLLAAGEISVGIYLPPDFERRIIDADRPVGQLLVDGSDPVVFSSARSLGELPLNQRIGSNVTRGQPAYALRALYNPERRSAVFIVPGLCGVILTLTMVLFTSIALVRERERGNLELLITTPVLPLELMTGKILPYILIGYIQVSLILFLGVYLFDVPIEGSLIDFALGTGIFVAATLTLGLMISTLADTQFQAFQMTFMSFLPQLLLSGYMFPFEGMPKAAQWLAELFPLTHYLRIVRGILLRDADLPLMLDQIWPLAVFFVVVMTIATLRFNKRLD